MRLLHCALSSFKGVASTTVIMNNSSITPTWLIAVR
eukprot:CAMPEP_0168519344 /NCGR_PEP_ID=MMETSP0405-20121227/7260_1 /TAXON_ID=498012 /ORGANISM="Trichosphaerium sp, Strain Am-I-7 wt" /LENGTH=35 /DNA_ID= /DNA_START= /DNA_END= /DNA_ORIENTATION=